MRISVNDKEYFKTSTEFMNVKFGTSYNAKRGFQPSVITPKIFRDKKINMNDYKLWTPVAPGVNPKNKYTNKLIDGGLKFVEILTINDKDKDKEIDATNKRVVLYREKGGYRFVGTFQYIPESRTVNGNVITRTFERISDIIEF